MDNPVEHYWQLRLAQLAEQLDANNFQSFVVADTHEAAKLIMETLVPQFQPKTVAYGGSMTLKSLGVLDALAAKEGVELLSSDLPGLSADEKIEIRRQGLLADLYLTGTNAVTEDGKLVNLDMIGNRVGGLTFGPKNVVVVIGRNKLVQDIESGMIRIKEYACPTNAMRLDCKTPCVKTGYCGDCKSPGRICNTWTITEKSFPKGRITVIIVNQDLGL